MENEVILLVEDNPMDAALMLRALKRNCITNQVVIAGDGVEALDYLFGSADDAGCVGGALPRVVLLDLKLPKVDGFEVLRRIRADERMNRLPVVVLTSSNEKQDSDRAYFLGADTYIQKPVDYAEFLDVVKHLGQIWLCSNTSSSRDKAS